MADLVLTQRFYPELGGSISWLQEVYSFWPTPYKVITHRYPELDRIPEIALPNCQDIIRANILMDDWGINNLGSLRKYLRCFSLIKNALVPKTDNTIHCAHIIPEGLSAISARISSPAIKVAAYVHGEELLAYGVSRELSALFKLIAGSIDLFIANSRNTVNLLRSMRPEIDPARIQIVHPCIQRKLYRLDTPREVLRSELKLEARGCYLITLGRLILRKNQRAVIEALARLVGEFPDLRYICIGSGPERENLTKLTEYLDLRDKVLFYENTTDELKIKLLNAADIFVLPTIPTETDIEGFGIALLEAQAAGLPVICGNSGGEKEAVMENITAFIVDGQDSTALTSEIHRLVRYPELRQQLGQSGISNSMRFESAETSQQIYNLITNCQKWKTEQNTGG